MSCEREAIQSPASGGRLPSPARFPFRYAAGIFLIAVIARIGFAFVVPSRAYGNELQKVALNLAHGSYSSPFLCHTGPTAIIPPGYPALLAPIYRWSRRPAIPIGVLSIAISSASCALLPLLASVAGLNAFTGILAGLLGALFPYSPFQDVRGPQLETLLTFLLVSSLILTARIGSGRGILCGFAWGIVFLTGPQALPASATILGFMFWRGFRKQVITASLLALLTVSPWIARNYLTFGQLFWIRSGAGLEFYLSNNPGSVALSRENHVDTISYKVHPAYRREACLKVQQIGEVNYFNDLGRTALAWCRNNPGKFARLTFQRIGYYWFPPAQSFSHRAWLALTTVLGFAGVLLWIRRHVLATALAAAVLGVLPLFYYLIQMNPRYRVPTHPILLLGAAEFLLWAGACPVVGKTRSQPRPL